MRSLSLLALALLVPMSALADPVIWSYSNCINRDGVQAQPDASFLTVTYGATLNTPIQFQWTTTLFAGDDEMAQAQPGGGTLNVSDPDPWSPTWNIPSMNFVRALNGTVGTNYQWSQTANATVVDPLDPTQTSIADNTPGTVSYSELHGTDGSVTPTIVLQQTIPNLDPTTKQANGTAKRTTSIYTAAQFVRWVYNVDVNGEQTTGSVTRACGNAASSLVQEVFPPAAAVAQQ